LRFDRCDRISANESECARAGRSGRGIAGRDNRIAANQRCAGTRQYGYRRRCSARNAAFGLDVSQPTAGGFLGGAWPHRPSRWLDDLLKWRFLPAIHDLDELDRRLSRLDARLQQRHSEVDFGLEPERQSGGSGRHRRLARGDVERGRNQPVRRSNRSGFAGQLLSLADRRSDPRNLRFLS